MKSLQGKTPASDWSFIVRGLVDAGVMIEPNDLWTYDAISEVAGRRIQGDDNRLQEALRRLARDHSIEFKNKPGVGYLRLDDEGIVEQAPIDRRIISRRIERAQARVANIGDFDSLPNHMKKQVNLQHAILGSMKLIMTPKVTKQIADQVNIEEVRINQDAVLKLFRNKSDERST